MPDEIEPLPDSKSRRCGQFGSPTDKACGPNTTKNYRPSRWLLMKMAFILPIHPIAMPTQGSAVRATQTEVRKELADEANSSPEATADATWRR